MVKTRLAGATRCKESQIDAERSDERSCVSGPVGVRSNKYLNNMIEQDHRRIKQRIRPMLGFKRFDTAAITITGIELAEKIRKHQFKSGKLAGRPKTMSGIWAAVIAA